MRRIVLGVLGSSVFCTLAVSNADAACPPGLSEANVGGAIHCMSFGHCVRSGKNFGFNDKEANDFCKGNVRIRWQCPGGQIAARGGGGWHCVTDFSGRGP